MDTIGNRIKLLRIKLNLTQEQLANKLTEVYGYPINTTTLSLFENDKRLPSVDAIFYLTKVFQCSADHLLNIENNPNNNLNMNDNDLKYLIIKKVMYIIENMSIEEMTELIDILNQFN